MWGGGDGSLDHSSIDFSSYCGVNQSAIRGNPIQHRGLLNGRDDDGSWGSRAGRGRKESQRRAGKLSHLNMIVRHAVIRALRE